MAVVTTNVPLTYANRAAFLADGWSFLAKTAAGADRDTESGTGVTYNPLVTLISTGTIENATNTASDMMFHPLNAAWSSIRIQYDLDPEFREFVTAGLLLYLDDDNYIGIVEMRNHSIAVWREATGTVATVASDGVFLPTTNIHLRIDRAKDGVTCTFSYSTDGANWTTVYTTDVSTLGEIGDMRMGLVGMGRTGGNMFITWDQWDYDTGWSDALDTPSVTISDTTDPSSVGGTDGSITVTWPDVDGADHYVAEIADGLGATTGFTVVSSTATSPFVFSGLAAGEYTVAITAIPPEA